MGRHDPEYGIRASQAAFQIGSDLDVSGKEQTGQIQIVAAGGRDALGLIRAMDPESNSVASRHIFMTVTLPTDSVDKPVYEWRRRGPIQCPESDSNRIGQELADLETTTSILSIYDVNLLLNRDRTR